MKRIVKDVFHFAGDVRPPAVASPDGTIWRKKDTSAAGAPTVQVGDGGVMELALAADNEVENLCLYFGDIKPYDVDDLISMEMLVRCSASLDSAVMLAFGLAGDRNDALDSVAQHAWFRIEGNNNVLVESDDGTTDVDDKSTGLTLSTTLRRFRIDFAEGLLTQGPPNISVGGKKNIIFSMENSSGLLRRVCENTQFTLAAYTGTLQPFFQIQKTAAAVTGTLGVKRIEIEHRVAG